MAVGFMVGFMVGLVVGLGVGLAIGLGVGLGVGLVLGAAVGSNVVGTDVVGLAVGLAVGGSVFDPPPQWQHMSAALNPRVSWVPQTLTGKYWYTSQPSSSSSTAPLSTLMHNVVVGAKEGAPVGDVGEDDGEQEPRSACPPLHAQHAWFAVLPLLPSSVPNLMHKPALSSKSAQVMESPSVQISPQLGS